MTLLESLAPA